MCSKVFIDFKNIRPNHHKTFIVQNRIGEHFRSVIFGDMRLCFDILLLVNDDSLSCDDDLWPSRTGFRVGVE